MEGDRSVSIGRIFERAFAVMGRDPVTVLGAALLFGAIPGVVFSLLTIGWRAQALADGPLALLPLMLLSITVLVASSSIAAACITHATVADADGEFAGVAASLNVGLRRFLPVIIVSVLGTLATMLGVFLLIVPGIMLALRWSVTAPVIVEERIGIFAAFGRAARLTKGARWKILGLFLILMVCFVAISWLLGLASTLLIGFSYNNTFVAFSPVAVILNLLNGTIASLIWTTTIAALYVELRDWKDGPAGQSLAAVFQ